MTLADYRIDGTDPLRPTLTINGEAYDMASVRRMSIDFQAQDVPHLFLELCSGSGVVEGQGIVVQQVEVPADALQVLTEFLSGLDPSELERAMLDEFDGMTGTTGEACLSVLKRWVARG